MISVEFSLPIFSQVVALILAFLVIFNNPKEKANISFSILIFFGAFWIFCVFLSDFLKDYYSALFWMRMAIIGPVFCGSIFYYFSSIFPKQNKKIMLSDKILMFIFPLFFILLSQTSLNVEKIQIKEWGTEYVPGVLYYFLFIVLIIYFGLAFSNLLNKSNKIWFGSKIY